MSVKIGKRQDSKNLILNIVAFGVQFAISFYISPIIVSNVGASAYGFIGVANDFVSYASIIATIFNSVAARFIANSYYKKEYAAANKYFNSLIIANVIIAGILGLASILFIPISDKVLTIPASLLFDVKLTFALVFGAYIVSLITLVFTTATFVTNRTDINGIRNIIQYIVRFALIVIFLNFVSVKIYWIAFASLIATVVVAVMNVSLTKRLTPEISINLKEANKSYVAELAKSGCWMALTSISGILLRGLDLTVANVMLGDYEMGILSISQTMPNNITSVISVLAPLFTPTFIVYFAANNIKALVKNVNKTIKTMALILFVPVSGFIVFSYDFYSLWQKSLTHEELALVTILSILTVIQAYFNSTTATMAQLSVVVNKLKIPVFVSLGCGIVSIVVEFLLLIYTDLGLYAIVIPTTIVMVLRYIMFNSWYAAYCLKQPRFVFLLSPLKTWLSIPVLIAFMYVIRIVLPVHSWVSLGVDALLCGVIGYALMIVLYGGSAIKEILKKVIKK